MSDPLAHGKLDFTPNISQTSLSLSRADPCHLLYFHSGIRTFSRFLLSRQPDDLNKAMLILTKQIYLPLTQDTLPSSPNIFRIFYYLTLCIFYRAMESKRPEDVKCCIRFFRYLHGQWHGVSMDALLPLTTAFVCVLAVQVKLKLEDVDRDIEEMANLCDQLLNSDISIQLLIGTIEAFARTINLDLQGPVQVGRKNLSEKVTDCLRKAIVRLPDLHHVSIVLARYLNDRFVVSLSNDDYEEGMAILDRIITFCGSGDEPSPYKEEALNLATLLASSRFTAYGKPEHLEHAIYRHRTLLDGTSIEDPYRAIKIRHLSQLEEMRLDDTGNNRDALLVPPESGKLPSFRELITSFPGPMDVTSDPMTLYKLYSFTSLIDQLTDVADIKDGVEHLRLLIISYPRGYLASLPHKLLGVSLYRAFELTHEIGYLNEAISTIRDGIHALDSHSRRDTLVRGLLSFLSTRLELLRHEEDLHEVMQLFPAVAGHDVAHSQLPNSFFWATTARRFGHPSVSTAYDHAMSWMHASLTFAPTLDKQHSRLVGTSGLHAIPLDYASYHIHTGHFEKAIEALEQGRGLLWSEMRGLRTSVDQIRLANSDLADRLSTVNQELETLSLGFSLNNNLDGNNEFEGMDSYGHGVIRKQKLLDDRERLISQIRGLSGFHTFLKPPLFDTLRFAASHGPIIIINHCKWRSDMLILLHNSPPSLIPTSDDFYTRANKLQDQLLGERKKGLESDAYEDALRGVLKELYELVGRPVIKRLNELKVPEQSRVWWCPTSVFCSLPLHAMGPIPSDVGPPRYFLDIYIPSYTPSLSALINSHLPNSQAFKKPSTLLVLQPDETMVRALEEMKAVQRASSRVTTLIGATATPTVVLERLRDHRFAHVVCHGLLEPGKPFDSSFKLHQGKRLSLIDIVRSRLPNAEFAFLAACHTAELTDESPADEALHLAAAMQYCGFRSVVGTVWAMADTDGRDFAENFYRSVFSSGKQGVCYYERTAEALRDAVVRLRRRKGRGMSLERWVNYVHYGA